MLTSAQIVPGGFGADDDEAVLARPHASDTCARGRRAEDGYHRVPRCRHGVLPASRARPSDRFPKPLRPPRARPPSRVNRPAASRHRGARRHGWTAHTEEGGQRFDTRPRPRSIVAGQRPRAPSAPPRQAALTGRLSVPGRGFSMASTSATETSRSSTSSVGSSSAGTRAGRGWAACEPIAIEPAPIAPPPIGPPPLRAHPHRLRELLQDAEREVPLPARVQLRPRQPRPEPRS